MSQLRSGSFRYNLRKESLFFYINKENVGMALKRLCFSERFKLLPISFFTNARTTHSFCTSAKNTSTNSNNKNNYIADERYQQLDNLDMMTAAKILFTDPPKKKQFGFDFHLVQFFFACLPSLAVYLVAQYARYDMRKMEVEVEQKRKQKEEEEEAKEREKEMELNPSEVKEEKSDPQLSEVKVRLDKLEEVVKEIVVETKNQSGSKLAKNQVTNDEKKHPISSALNSTSTPDSASNKVVDEDNLGKHNYLKSKPELHEESKGSVATGNSSLLNPKDQNQSGGAS